MCEEQKENIEEQPDREEQLDVNDLLGYGLSKVIPKQKIDFEGRIEDFCNNELIF